MATLTSVEDGIFLTWQADDYIKIYYKMKLLWQSFMKTHVIKLA